MSSGPQDRKPNSPPARGDGSAAGNTFSGNHGQPRFSIPPPTISTTITSAPFSFAPDETNPVALDSRPPMPDNAGSTGSAPPHPQPQSHQQSQSGAPFAGGSQNPWADPNATIPPTPPSNPPMPTGGHPTPDQPVAYHTRPPWMPADDPQPGATIPPQSGTPFPGRLDTIPPMPVVGGSQPGLIGHTNPGLSGQTQSPFVTNDDDDDEEDAWYQKKTTRGSGGGPRERGVLTKLFILGAKMIPVALLLGAGYYGYQSFLGPVSEEERQAYLNSPVAGAADGIENMPKSRAGLMIQQAKDAVAAHDSHVHAANAMAENVDDLDKIAAAVEQSQQATRPAVPTPAPAASGPSVTLDLEGAARAQQRRDAGLAPASTTTGSRDQIQVRQKDGPAPLGLRASVTGNGVTMAQPATGGDQPAMDFREWVGNATVSGVVGGDTARAVVNNQVVSIGETVDARLGIVFDRVVESHRVIVFTDATGASVGKRY